MNIAGAVPADVYVDRGVTGESRHELVMALAAAGVDARLRVQPTRRGVEQLHWVVLVAVPLQAFLTSVGEKAATDAWAGVKKALRRIAGRPEPGGTRPLVLQDPESGLQIVLPPDLSDEGYRLLTELDVSRFRRGPIRYDTNAGRWISDLDQAYTKDGLSAGDGQ